MLDFTETKRLLTDTEALVLTVYGEARGESIEGQVAVMNVIMNRAKTRHRTIKEICFEPKQFSCWNFSDPNFPILKELAEKAINSDLPNEGILSQIKYLAAGVLGNYFRDNTVGAEYYMTNALFNSDKRPSWALKPHSVIVIGKHTFLQV